MEQTIKLKPEEVVIWDIFFAGVVSMARCHPGAGTLRYGNEYIEIELPHLDWCAQEALDMIAVRRKVVGE